MVVQYVVRLRGTGDTRTISTVKSMAINGNNRVGLPGVGTSSEMTKKMVN